MSSANTPVETTEARPTVMRRQSGCGVARTEGATSWFGAAALTLLLGAALGRPRRRRQRFPR